MIRMSAIVIAFAVLSSSASAATKVTLIFTNSGDAGNVVIVDDICQTDAFQGFFAANDAEVLTDAFCVEDASVLKTNISIAINGTLEHQLEDVEANSTIDIHTGTITPP